MRSPFRIPRAAPLLPALVAATLAVSSLASSPARADVNVHVDFGNAPPPPRFVFMTAPRERRYAGEDFYVVDDPRLGDDDCFRSQGYYWVFRSGYWYRAPQWRGPFRAIDPRYVPGAFYRQPPGRWKHHPNGPPRFMDNGDHESNGYGHRDGGGHGQSDHRGGHGNDRGNDHGNDHGKHKDKGKGEDRDEGGHGGH